MANRQQRLCRLASLALAALLVSCAGSPSPPEQAGPALDGPTDAPEPDAQRPEPPPLPAPFADEALLYWIAKGPALASDPTCQQWRVSKGRVERPSPGRPCVLSFALDQEPGVAVLSSPRCNPPRRLIGAEVNAPWPTRHAGSCTRRIELRPPEGELIPTSGGPIYLSLEACRQGLVQGGMLAVLDLGPCQNAATTLVRDAQAEVRAELDRRRKLSGRLAQLLEKGGRAYQLGLADLGEPGYSDRCKTLKVGAGGKVTRRVYRRGGVLITEGYGLRFEPETLAMHESGTWALGQGDGEAFESGGGCGCGDYMDVDVSDPRYALVGETLWFYNRSACRDEMGQRSRRARIRTRVDDPAAEVDRAGLKVTTRAVWMKARTGYGVHVDVLLAAQKGKMLPASLRLPYKLDQGGGDSQGGVDDRTFTAMRGSKLLRRQFPGEGPYLPAVQAGQALTLRVCLPDLEPEGARCVATIRMVVPSKGVPLVTVDPLAQEEEAAKAP